MKYGVVYYKETDNIGDDIQNYAAIRFLPQVDYLIDRECLHDFQSEEPVAVIMNGWYLHNKFFWPPAKSIYPLCISMHFTKNDYMGIGYKYLDGMGGAYLKNYQPIGSRDASTFDVLQEKGIETYLSGCVTLTLSPREKKENVGNYICLVDVLDEVEEKIKNMLPSDSEVQIKKTTHWVDYKTAKISWDNRIKNVEELLDIYQNARCVITKRLHCALPCLALGTPVLLLLDEEKDDVTRYSHFTDLLHVASTEEFVKGLCSYDVFNPPSNKDTYLKEREKLIQIIEQFVLSTKETTLPLAFLNWQEVDTREIEKWRMQLTVHAAQHAASQFDILLKEKNKIEKDAFDRLSDLAKQYDIDTQTLKNYIEEKEKEILRLNCVVVDKDDEVKRLNDEKRTSGIGRLFRSK